MAVVDGTSRAGESVGRPGAAAVASGEFGPAAISRVAAWAQFETRTAAALGAHAECRQSARNPGARLCHRQRRGRRDSAQCRARKAGYDHRSAAGARQHSRQSRRHFVTPRMLAGDGRLAPRTLLALIALGSAALGSALTVSNPTLASGLDLPHENALPGGIKILHLDSGCPSLPYVDADGHRALVLPDDSKWVAVIGIPLSAPLGMRQVIVRGTNGRQVIEFSVGNKQYASQSLKVAPRHVNLSAPDLA